MVKMLTSEMSLQSVTLQAHLACQHSLFKMLEPLLLIRLVWLLICIAGLTEHHAAWSTLSKEQVQEGTNEWNGPDDH
jgi:hypothetical protein